MKDLIFITSGFLLIATVVFDICKTFVLIWSFDKHDLQEALTATLIAIILYSICKITEP